MREDEQVPLKGESESDLEYEESDEENIFVRKEPADFLGKTLDEMISRDVEQISNAISVLGKDNKYPSSEEASDDESQSPLSVIGKGNRYPSSDESSQFQPPNVLASKSPIRRELKYSQEKLFDSNEEEIAGPEYLLKQVRDEMSRLDELVQSVPNNSYEKDKSPNLSHVMSELNAAMSVFQVPVNLNIGPMKNSDADQGNVEPSNAEEIPDNSSISHHSPAKRKPGQENIEELNTGKLSENLNISHLAPGMSNSGLKNLELPNTEELFQVLDNSNTSPFVPLRSNLNISHFAPMNRRTSSENLESPRTYDASPYEITRRVVKAKDYFPDDKSVLSHDSSEHDHQDIFFSKRSIYNASIGALDIAEDLDSVMTAVKVRFGKNIKPDQSSITSIEQLKNQVTERICKYANMDSLPALPNDPIAATDLLLARDRLTKNANFNRRVDRSSLIDALFNAFQLRDWNDDGLIDVDDCCRILEEFSEWISGQPARILAGVVLKATGLDILGPNASRHLSFQELKLAFEILVKPSFHYNQYSESESNSSSSESEQEEEKTKENEVVPVEHSTYDEETNLPSVDPHELRKLADQIRRANELLRGTHHESKGSAENLPTPDFEYRPPAFNPYSRYPSAPPPPAPSHIEDTSVMVINLNELESKVQHATIQYYQQRLAKVAAVNMKEIKPEELKENKMKQEGGNFTYDGKGRLSVRQTKSTQDASTSPSEDDSKNYSFSYNASGKLSVRPKSSVRYSPAFSASVTTREETSAGFKSSNRYTPVQIVASTDVARLSRAYNFLAEAKAKRKQLQGFE